MNVMPQAEFHSPGPIPMALLSYRTLVGETPGGVLPVP